jgi:glutathione-regulated potassium-efflux system ancillary protein KefF
MAKVLVLAAHPNWQVSRVNRVLLKSARAAADQARQALASVGDSNTIEVRDLYHLYPDFLIDVAAEQQAMAEAQLVVWQHPIQWYSMPPLMKLWLDEVLQYGWAYGEQSSQLNGKDVWLVASTGGSSESYHPADYNRYFFEAFMPPYEQTATLCGMRWLPPLLLHGANRVSDEELSAHAHIYAQRLVSYPDWPEMADLESCPACLVPTSQRPDPR